MGYFISDEQKEEIMTRVNDMVKSDAYYYIMIILSCTIATYGLISNSSAVIIGAMLISPLMAPIIGSAMSVAEEDNRLLIKSIQTLILGTAIAFVLAILLTLIMPVKMITPEILARTKPTIIDLIIALASGAAATYAVCYKPDSAALPGVAISTALMPPLCVVGIGIANQNYQVALGAVLLFMANIIAINFSSIVIFKIFGFKKAYKRKHKMDAGFTNKALGSKLTYSVLLLILISIPLTYFMYTYFEDNKVEDILRTSIKEEFISMAVDAQLVSLEFKNEPKQCLVTSVVRANKELEQIEIRQIENIIEYKMGKPVKLDMSVVLVQRINDEGSVSPYRNLISEISATQNEPVSKTSEVIEKVYTPEEIIGITLEEKFSLISGIKIDDYMIQYNKQQGIYKIQVNVEYNGLIDKKNIDVTTFLLEQKLKRKVVIEVIQSYGPSNNEVQDQKNDVPTNIIPLPEEEIIQN